MGDNRKVDFKALKDRTRGQMPAVLAHYGITPLNQQEQTRIRCPFHDDERPSCTVNLTAGVFSCKAAGCGVEGGLLDFVQKACKPVGDDQAAAGRAWSSFAGRKPG